VLVRQRQEVQEVLRRAELKLGVLGGHWQGWSEAGSAPVWAGERIAKNTLESAVSRHLSNVTLTNEYLG